MKRRSFLVLISLAAMLAVSPLSVLASEGERVEKDVIVNYSSSNGVKRTLDNDFAIAPIGKPISPTKMNTAPPPPRQTLESVKTNSGDSRLSALSASTLIADADATITSTLTKKVHMYGSTFSTTKVDLMKHYLSLYRYDGTTWSRILDMPAMTKTNTYSFTSGTSAITVAKGYYYETEMFAIAEHGSATHALSRYSGTIYISN